MQFETSVTKSHQNRFKGQPYYLALQTRITFRKVQFTSNQAKTYIFNSVLQKQFLTPKLSKLQITEDKNYKMQFQGGEDGFGGLAVSMLATGTQFCGFKPGRSRWIFRGVKILSKPSSGGKVKESVPCPSFAACKRTQ